MKSTDFHIKVLVIILLLTGISMTAYQVLIQKTPLRESQTADMWTVDARINFSVRGPKPVDVLFYVPSSGDYDITDELFIANGYGQSVVDDGLQRQVNWTARRINGVQTIFYRMNIAKSPVKPEYKGETWRNPIEVDTVEQAAVNTLLEEIRAKSSDTRSFITTTISIVNEATDNNVRLLRGSDTPENRLRVMSLILSHAHIPSEPVHVLPLVEGSGVASELWLGSYIEVTRTDEDNSLEGGWHYFNIDTGIDGLSADRLVWYTGSGSMVDVRNGEHVRLDFSITKKALSAASLVRLSEQGPFAAFSFYSMPITTQHSYALMLVIPFGVLVILVLRNIVGVETLGTFTPVLLSLAFRETGLLMGLAFFLIITFLGLSLRSYLEFLKLQMLPRLSVVLTFVIVAIVLGGLLCHKLGFDRGLSMTLFPMVILTMSIERLSVTWEERGGPHAFKVALGTLFAAAVVYLVINMEWMMYVVFTFPGILLLLVAFMIMMGRYRGYRLTELFRFKALINKG